MFSRRAFWYVGWGLVINHQDWVARSLRSSLELRRSSFVFKWFLHECNFFVLGLYFFSTTSWFLLRNRAPWWLWTELQKRLLKRFWNFRMLTALESSNSNTAPIRSKHCLLEKKYSCKEKKVTLVEKSDYWPHQFQWPGVIPRSQQLTRIRDVVPLLAKKTRFLDTNHLQLVK